jgi:glycosyltransferase involved in cell wall biosynthesis
MLKFYYITDQISSRGGYKASKNNIEVVKIKYPGKIINIDVIKKNVIFTIKIFFYKIFNYFFKKFFIKDTIITFPQFFNLINIKEKKVFFIHYANLIFNFNIINNNKKSLFIIYLYDEWWLNGFFHFNKNYSNNFLKNLDKVLKRKKMFALNNKNTFIIASTNYLKNQYLKINPMATNIHQNYYPIDINFWKKKKLINSKKFSFFNKKYDYILFIAKGGVINHRKGGDFFIKILNKFKNNSKIKFIILGEYNSSSLKKKFHNIESVNINNDDDLLKLYSIVKLNLTLSRYENLPYSILESMSCGVINISFDVGGITEIIQHKENGWVSKIGDLKELEKGIKWGLQNHNQLKNKLPVIIKKYNFNSIKNHFKILKKIIKEKI